MVICRSYVCSLLGLTAKFTLYPNTLPHSCFIHLLEKQRLLPGDMSSKIACMISPAQVLASQLEYLPPASLEIGLFFLPCSAVTALDNGSKNSPPVSTMYPRVHVFCLHIYQWIIAVTNSPCLAVYFQEHWSLIELEYGKLSVKINEQGWWDALGQSREVHIDSFPAAG